jgi:hypothetical protein
VPLHAVLTVLIVLDLLLLAGTAALGMTLSDSASIYRHYVLGMAASMFTCFIHVLVLFYLIGTGKDLRDAVEGVPDLVETYVPMTRRLKRRVFPPACFAIALMVVATLMGGEVHSRLLAADGGRTLPVQGITAWWVHLLFVVLALVASIVAFQAEVSAARETRRAIEALNAELARREESPGAG